MGSTGSEPPAPFRIRPAFTTIPGPSSIEEEVEKAARDEAPQAPVDQGPKAVPAEGTVASASPDERGDGVRPS